MQSENQNQITFRTVLGGDETGCEYDVSCQDFGMKGGVKYDCVEINPVNEVADFDKKALQVVYKEDEEIRNNMKYTTISVNEAPYDVTDSNVISKTVVLCDDEKSTAAATELSGQASNKNEPEIFASDSEALKYFQFFSKPPANQKVATKGAVVSEDSNNGVYLSDTDALKYCKFSPHSQQAAAEFSGTEPNGIKENDEEQMQVFASDAEALKFISFQPKQPPTQSSNTTEIFASDDEALKFIKFSSHPLHLESANQNQLGQAAQSHGSSTTETAGTDNDMPEIFASDDEALKFIKFSFQPPASNNTASCQAKAAVGSQTPPSSPTEKQQSEQTECTYVTDNVSNTNSQQFGTTTDAAAADTANAALLAEANVTLKDDKSFNVKVTGTDLPNGLHKKVIAVSGQAGQGLTAAEVERLQVSVEETMNADGTVQKFVVIE